MPQTDWTQPLHFLQLGNRMAMWPMMWWEMYWATVETVGYRLDMMASAGLNPSARQQRENLRMIHEKAQAGLESWQALTRASTDMNVMWNWPLVWAAGLADTTDAMVHPWRRRVTANAKRLRRQR